MPLKTRPAGCRSFPSIITGSPNLISFASVERGLCRNGSGACCVPLEKKKLVLLKAEVDRFIHIPRRSLTERGIEYFAPAGVPLNRLQSDRSKSRDLVIYGEYCFLGDFVSQLMRYCASGFFFYFFLLLPFFPTLRLGVVAVLAPPRWCCFVDTVLVVAVVGIVVVVVVVAGIE